MKEAPLLDNWPSISGPDLVLTDGGAAMFFCRNEAGISTGPSSSDAAMRFRGDGDDLGLSPLRPLNRARKPLAILFCSLCVHKKN